MRMLTLRVIEFYNPAFFPAITLTSLHDLGGAPSLPLKAIAQRLVKLQKSDGYWVTEDRITSRASESFLNYCLRDRRISQNN